nr:hypothetical protein [Tanacetum cinerariifolium]
DHESFVDKIICGLNKAPDSPHLHTFLPNQFHCFHCKDVLGDGEACQRCTCKRCGSGLSKGLCLICGNNQNSPNDSPNISANSSHNLPHIDERCFECGNTLDGIFRQRCACKSSGKGAHIGYNCSPKVSIISNLEPCNQTMNNEPLQTLPSFDPMRYSEKENSSPCVSKPNSVEESSNVFNPPPQPPVYSCKFCGSNSRYGHCCTPQVPLIYPEPGYSQDFNSSQNFHDFQQQYICCDQCGGPHKTFQCQQVISCEPCCENCGVPHKNFQCQPLNNYEPNTIYDSNYSGFDQFGDFHTQQDLCCDNCEGLHETFQCQPMNQNCYNFNSSGFDQTQPTQYPVIHPPPQETSNEILHDQENDRVFKIKEAFGNEHYKPEDLQELFHKLLNDVQNIHEELAEYINTPGWNRPAFYNNGDDDDIDYTIAITPVLSTEEPNNSLSMVDEHLDTILSMESDEVIKYSVEDLVLILSESVDHFELVINSNDDYSSSDYDSLYYENIEYVEASPYDSELVSLEVEKIVISEDEEIEDDNLHEKLLKFPVTDRSDFTHEEFADELAHIISLLEYECFYFGICPIRVRNKRKKDIIRTKQDKKGKRENKREKDKIGTKPDQIKEKQEAWKSPALSKPITVKKERKMKKIQSPGAKTDKP